MNRRAFLRSLGAAPAAWMLAKYGIPSAENAFSEGIVAAWRVFDEDRVPITEIIRDGSTTYWRTKWVTQQQLRAIPDGVLHMEPGGRLVEYVPREQVIFAHDIA